MTLLERLLQDFPTAKRQTLKRWVQAGRVMVNGSAARALKQTVGDAEVVRIVPEAAPAKPKLPFVIVFEDRDILVIDKPAGLLTSTGPREKRPTALAIAREYLPDARVGLVHRLDREASGLLVFAKNAAALASLKKQFAAHSAGRIYLAVVSPPPKKTQGRIQSRLIELADGSVHTTTRRGRGREAVTHFREIHRRGDRATLRVQLQTGRKHQIRAHLSEMGSPIVGDRAYGGLPHPAGLMLAAVELQLDHPHSGKRITFKIDPPARMRDRGGDRL
jgi:23S rRNA pseudouridine1911/1915/1917 synthase